MKWQDLAVRISGRWVAPLFLAVAAVLALLVHYTFQRSEIAEQVSSAESQRLRERLSVEQVRLNLHLGLDNALMVRRLVSELALHDGIERAYLVGTDGTIEAALLRSELGQTIDQMVLKNEFPDLTLRDMASRKPSMAMEVLQPDGQPWLVGQVPIQDGRRLLVAADLAMPLTTRMVAMERDLLREGTLLLVAVALLAVILHMLWFRRAERLAMALRRMAVTGTKAPQYRMNYECAAESRRIFEEGETVEVDY